MQTCDECGQVQFPLAPCALHPLWVRPEGTWTEVDGAGTVYAKTVKSPSGRGGVRRARTLRRSPSSTWTFGVRVMARGPGSRPEACGRPGGRVVVYPRPRTRPSCPACLFRPVAGVTHGGLRTQLVPTPAAQGQRLPRRISAYGETASGATGTPRRGPRGARGVAEHLMHLGRAGPADPRPGPSTSTTGPAARGTTVSPTIAATATPAASGGEPAVHRKGPQSRRGRPPFNPRHVGGLSCE